MARPRILAGTAKGQVLETPTRGTRPSPARLREAVFDMVQFRTRGPFLDLYAGSGAVGLEAASRGFPVVCVERDRRAAEVVRRNARRLGLDAEVLRGDALAYVRAHPAAFELVFAAPPYPIDLIEVFRAVLQAGPVRAGGRYLFQHPAHLDVRAALAPELTSLAAAGDRPASMRRYGNNAITRVDVPGA